MEKRNCHPWRDGVRFFAAACAVYFLLDFPIRFTGAYSFPACVGIKSFLPFTLGMTCGPSAVAGAALGAVCTGLVCGTGAAECLAALRAAGLPLACVTNKPQALAQTLLEGLGLAQHFAHIFGGESFARRKPDPLPLLQACRALGSAPRHTLMVGDSVFDAQAARAAGCPFALLDYGYKGGVNAAAISADWRISSLAQLSVLITQVGEEETVSSLQ